MKKTTSGNDKTIHRTMLPAVTQTVSPIADPGFYLSVYQGTPSNELQKIRRAKPEEVDRITGAATVNTGALTVIIDGYEHMKSGFKSSTVKLIEAGIYWLTRLNSYRKENVGTIKHSVEFSLSYYMGLRDLHDRKEAREQIRSDCEDALSLRFSWDEKRGKDTQSFRMLNAFVSAELTKSGVIRLSFSPEFALALVSSYEMKLPALYWRLSDKRNPNSSPLLYRISLLKHMNRGKPGEDIVSVKTLLSNAPYIPEYDDVMAGNRNVRARIIDVLERDLDALAEVFSWEYCNSGGKPLTKRQIDDASWKTYSEMFAHFMWKDYPEIDI